MFWTTTLGDTGGVDGVDLIEAVSWLGAVGTDVNCDVSIVLSKLFLLLIIVASVYHISSCQVARNTQENNQLLKPMTFEWQEI